MAGWQKGAVEGERPVGDLWRGAHAGAVSQPKPERTGPGQPRRVWPLPDRGGEDGEAESWVTHRSQPAALGREPARCKFRSSNAWCYSNLAAWGAQRAELAGGAGRGWWGRRVPGDGARGMGKHPLVLRSPAGHLALPSAPCIIFPCPLRSFCYFPYLHPGRCVASTLFA